MSSPAKKIKREKAPQWCNGGEEDKMLWKMLSNGDITTSQRPMEIKNKFVDMFGHFSDNVFRHNLP